MQFCIARDSKLIPILLQIRILPFGMLALVGAAVQQFLVFVAHALLYRHISSGSYFPFVFCLYELRRPLLSFGRATNTKYQQPHAGGNPLPMIFFSSSRGLASHEANHISFCTKISSSTLAFRTRTQCLILVLLCSFALVSRPSARRALSTLHTKS